REENWSSDTRYGRPNLPELTSPYQHAEEKIPDLFRPETNLSDPARWDAFQPIRDYVTTVGAEQGWSAVDVPSYQSPVPFDEPVLGIIGMWRDGGGANPHFALALGETMLRVGQRYLAWNAFERASRMADRYSADPDIRRFLVSHCRGRQAAIEETLQFVSTDDASRSNPPWQHISPPPTAETLSRLTSAFDAELEDAMAFRQRCETYEEQQIASGRSVFDADFYSEFGEDRASISSSVGLEETVLYVPRKVQNHWVSRRQRAGTTFGSGIGAAFVAAVIQLVRALRGKDAKLSGPSELR
ncbi:MAG: hypothetical protein KDA89_19570, partial [Planctomycetaceae bacterium]|nr:hypothetical protein [Planctomycetaceae bacterium]